MDDQPNETQDLTNKIDKSGMRKEAKEKVNKQLKDARLCLVRPPPLWGRLPWAAR